MASHVISWRWAGSALVRPVFSSADFSRGGDFPNSSGTLLATCVYSRVWGPPHPNFGAQGLWSVHPAEWHRSLWAGIFGRGAGFFFLCLRRFFLGRLLCLAGISQALWHIVRDMPFSPGLGAPQSQLSPPPARLLPACSFKAGPDKPRLPPLEDVAERFGRRASIVLFGCERVRSPVGRLFPGRVFLRRGASPFAPGTLSATWG